ncbi:MULTISPECIES: hypothetical protein [unclassified Pseudonocardia]|uniref:hypothetical protein n=1 Tax=unclassified Pseudonocardia TaxID=2619320 RepID=UPI00095A6604|nr:MULTISPECIES: hypothetical protein [unclassified Pseudonocardia]OLL74516.1 ribonucleotide reductase [Pseudonocardia sp. Ae150A_Ps1]
MPNRWSTLAMDEAGVRDLSGLPSEAVLTHADQVIAGRPAPPDLYRQWERQQWSAVDVVLDQDRAGRDRLPARIRETVDDAVITFIVGEYTGLDMLGPILAGSPDETYSLFLGTQIADETRHAHLMFRLGEELLGLDPDPGRMLAHAWERSAPAHRELALLEGRLVRDLLTRPLDYGSWLRSCVLFHLLTEGVLALVGQRVLVQSLRGLDVLPGVRAAFTAMCRDESRHIGFGVHALRTGIQEGYGDDIRDVLEQAVPLTLQLDEQLAGPGPDFRRMSVDVLHKHLRSIGMDEGFSGHLLAPYRAGAVA